MDDLNPSIRSLTTLSSDMTVGQTNSDIPTTHHTGADQQILANRARINNVQGDQINYHYNVYGNFTSVGSFQPGTYDFSAPGILLTGMLCSFS